MTEAEFNKSTSGYSNINDNMPLDINKNYITDTDILSEKSYSELKSIAANMGLRATGKKSELIERITDALASPGTADNFLEQTDNSALGDNSLFSNDLTVEEINFFGDSSELTAQASELENSDESFEVDNEEQISFFEDTTRKQPLIREIPEFLPLKPKSGRVTRKKVYDQDKPRATDTIFDFVELFIFSLVVVLIITSFFFRHSKVQGASMENTLHDGDHLIVSDAFYTPERGDIVVIMDYSTGLDFALVKRVIAIEGDHVKVSSTGVVTVNGERLQEEYVFTDGPVINRTIDLIVPEGEIFVLGDHRNNSTDSRAFGTVKTDSIIGKVLIRVYPFDKFGTVD